MLFNSFEFLILLTLTFSAYYLPKINKHQILLLIASSLIFYSFENYKLVVLLLFSAGINIVTSYYVVFGNQKYKKITALSGIIINLGVLAFFKYSKLIGLVFVDPGDSLGRFLVQLPLPIGISFFTFEGISLVIDVWKEKYVNNKVIVSKSFAKHAQRTLFFISFFPHLIAGPILKAHDFFPQMKQKYFKNIQWESAVKALIIGYFLKMVVADNLKDFTHWTDISTMLASPTLFTLMIGYSFQIFADFAGYSSIAIGLAKLFGYDFNQNFNFPYIATSFKDFWKRWHISLSTFLMEYLYFPLGGNRKGKFRTYLNLIVTMTLGGLWHGAAWSFAFWGFFHGTALAVERFITNNSEREAKNKAFLVAKGVFVFLVVSILWVPFRMSFEDTSVFFGAMLSNIPQSLTPYDINLITAILMYSLPVVVYHVAYLYKGKVLNSFFRKTEFVFYAVMILLIFTNSGSSGAFIYFQF